MNFYHRLFFVSIIFILTLFMIINPRETVYAAGEGFALWYSVIVPALLPFFIVAELLVSLGFAHFLGVLLEPVMRPVFKLPGAASLVVAMGFTSGFPIGAVLTRRLYEDKLLTGPEAERVISFTNNSSPLFILGAVGVGMFNSPLIGGILALSHYLSNILVGLIHGLHVSRDIKTKRRPMKILFQAALQALADNKNNDPPGKLLSDSVKNSINNILAIAGFIIIFSVLTRMLSVWGIMNILSLILKKIFFFWQLPAQVSYGMSMGLFEITIGSKAIASAITKDIFIEVMAVSIVLAFSGFSIIAQVMGVAAGLPVRLSFYLKSRAMQMVLSAVITWFSCRILILNETVNAMAVPLEKAFYSINAWQISLWSMLVGLFLIGIMVLISCCRSAK
jgi:sporulation integral membrane protein YlbJ